jgi:acetoin utilization protein AcuB
MFVRDYMTRKLVAVAPEASFPQAISIMRKNKIRHLPVVEDGILVGIIVEKDLLSNQPSPATTLSVFEIYSLLEKLLVRQMMTRPVITVQGDCPIGEAARIMVENKISCLPVVEGDSLVGIITETDIFKVLVEVLGGSKLGFRITVRMPDQVGELAAIAARIAEAGGNIFAITTSHPGGSEKAQVTFKETGADRVRLMDWIENCGIEIVDVRSTERYKPTLFE